MLTQSAKPVVLLVLQQDRSLHPNYEMKKEQKDQRYRLPVTRVKDGGYKTSHPEVHF